MSKNPSININTIFKINYDDCLQLLTEEERKRLEALIEIEERKTL